jgi:hypothetical protein
VSVYQVSILSAPALLTQNVRAATMDIILMEIVAYGRTPTVKLMIKIITVLLVLRDIYSVEIYVSSIIYAKHTI